MSLVLAIGFFGALCLGVEAFTRLARPAPELARKLAHISAAVFAAALPLALSFPQIAALGLVFAAAMAVSIRIRLLTSIHGVARTTYGEVLFPLGIAVLALAVPSPLPFAYGVLVLGLGDGLAALVGMRLGTRVVPLLPTRKTLWGSGTFLVVSFALGVALLVAGGVAPLRAAAAAAAIAVALTPVELLLTYGLDNLFLPALGGLLLAGL